MTKGSPVSIGRCWQRSHDHINTSHSAIHQFTRNGLESAANDVAHDCIPYFLRDDESKPRGISLHRGHDAHRHCLRRVALATAQDPAKVIRGEQAIRLRQHRRLKRKALYGLCDDARSGWRAQLACACADGNHEPSRDDGYWVEKFSCSLLYLHSVVISTGQSATRTLGPGK